MEKKENQVLIETKRLKKYFSVPAGHLHAVDDVNLTINKGETLGIVGESGCGNLFIFIFNLLYHFMM